MKIDATPAELFELAKQLSPAAAQVPPAHALEQMTQALAAINADKGLTGPAR
jgi:hypothetical protein